MAKYLKDILAERGIPIDFEFLGRSELTEKRKKDGGTYEVHEYTFLSAGQVHTENIFPKTHDKVLSKAQRGDICRAELNGEWVNWTILPRGEAVLDLPHPPVSRSLAANRAVAQEDRSQKIKEVCISLQGLTQAYIIQGAENPLDRAVQMRQAIIDKATELAS